MNNRNKKNHGRTQVNSTKYIVGKLNKLIYVNKVDIDEIINISSDITTKISTECDMLIDTFEKCNYDKEIKIIKD